MEEARFLSESSLRPAATPTSCETGACALTISLSWVEPETQSGAGSSIGRLL